MVPELRILGESRRGRPPVHWAPTTKGMREGEGTRNTLLLSMSGTAQGASFSFFINTAYDKSHHQAQSALSEAHCVHT